MQTSSPDSLLRVQAVLLRVVESIPDTPVIRGYDFNTGRDLDGLMASMLTTGFQATALGQAVNEVNRMVGWSGLQSRTQDRTWGLGMIGFWGCSFRVRGGMVWHDQHNLEPISTSNREAGLAGSAGRCFVSVGTCGDICSNCLTKYSGNE